MFLEKFKYILVYLDACYVILITGCSNYLQLRHFFPLFWFFLKIAFFKHISQNILKTVQAIHGNFQQFFRGIKTIIKVEQIPSSKL